MPHTMPSDFPPSGRNDDSSVALMTGSPCLMFSFVEMTTAQLYSFDMYLTGAPATTVMRLPQQCSAMALIPSSALRISSSCPKRSAQE